MQQPGSYILKWEDFSNNLGSFYNSLRNSQDFTDVTLACEDGRQVEAHKVILSTSSPFFMDLLQRSQHPHPIIYMRGLSSSTLVALLDFIYRGEVSLEEVGLEEFFKLGQELKLVGLQNQTGSDDEIKEIGGGVGSNLQGPTTKDSSENLKIHEKVIMQANVEKGHSETNLPKKKYKKKMDMKWACKKCGFIQKSQLAMLDHLKNSHADTNIEENQDFAFYKYWSCRLCEEDTTVKNDMVVHIENFHKTQKYSKDSEFDKNTEPFMVKNGEMWSCTKCGKISQYKHIISSHVDLKHLDKIYPCSLCGTIYQCKDSIRKHQYKCQQKQQEHFEIATDKNDEKNKTQEVNFQDLKTKPDSIDASGFRVVVDVPKSDIKEELDQDCKNLIDTDTDFGRTVKPQDKEYYERVKPFLLKVGKDPVKYHCKECGKIASNRAQMANHIELKHLDSSHQCSRCGNTYKCKDSLRKHQNRVCGLKVNYAL